MDNLTHNTAVETWVEDRLSESFKQGCREWRPDATAAFARYTRRRSQLRRRKLHIIRGALGVAVCLLTAFTLPQGSVFAKKCVAACVAGTARISHFVLSKVPGVFSNVLPKPHRQAAPDFALPDQSGHVVRLSALRGRVVLLNFWATWCNPCRTELPWFSDFQREYDSQGLSIVAVAMDDDGWNVVRPFISKLNVSFPVMVGGNALVNLYGGLNAVPTTLVIDRSGLVAATNIGIQQKEKYEAELAALLSEK